MEIVFSGGKRSIENFFESPPQIRKAMKIKSLAERVEEMTTEQLFNCLTNGMQVELIQGRFDGTKRWISFIWGEKTPKTELLTFDVVINIDHTNLRCRLTAKLCRTTSESLSRHLIRLDRLRSDRSNSDETGRFFTVSGRYRKDDHSELDAVRVQKIAFISEDNVELPPDLTLSQPPLSLKHELIELYFKDELREEITKLAQLKYTADVDRMVEAKVRADIEADVRADAVEKMMKDQAIIDEVKEKAKERLQRSGDFQEEVKSKLVKELLEDKKHTEFRRTVVLLGANEHIKRKSYQTSLRQKLIDDIKKEGAFRLELKREIERDETFRSTLKREIEKEPEFIESLKNELRVEMAVERGEKESDILLQSLSKAKGVN